MINRRRFLRASLLTSLSSQALQTLASNSKGSLISNPIVISTWNTGMMANEGAWDVLSKGGRALDAVEEGVKVIESSIDCCVGLGGNPDRDGTVTLDACIMDEHFNCGSVAFLERIKHPISVARRVMEKTPHVMLVGEGAQKFALSEGFPLEPDTLSESAKRTYEDWLKTSHYAPVVNIENHKDRGPSSPPYLQDGSFNHDTIGMIAMDAKGNLSGSCTTSGMAFKMRGRLGDSPIIGAGLYVDNEVGAVAATGQGEDVIRIAGAHTVVELMRQGMSPEKACKTALERILKIKGAKAKEIQVAFIALSHSGKVGAYALQKGFSYAVRNAKENRLYQANSLI